MIFLVYFFIMRQGLSRKVLTATDFYTKIRACLHLDTFAEFAVRMHRNKDEHKIPNFVPDLLVIKFDNLRLTGFVTFLNYLRCFRPAIWHFQSLYAVCKCNFLKKGTLHVCHFTNPSDELF